MAAALFVLMQVEIIAHRGASGEAPENTLAAFRLGWEQGDACELDVHLSKDGQIAVLHDATTRRTAGVDKPVVEQTLAELQALDARIPTLKQVLEILPEKKRLYIEIKCGPEILPELRRTLEAFPEKQPRLAIIGVGYDTMVQAKKLLTAIPAYWLSTAKPDKKTGKAPELEDLIAKCRAGGLDGLDLSHEFPIDKEFVAKVHAAGLKLVTWTVNDPDVALREAAAGVDGITTDRPKAMRQKLSMPK
jgi:glycerophosphoryl diester phosphodiesterase